MAILCIGRSCATNKESVKVVQAEKGEIRRLRNQKKEAE